MPREMNKDIAAILGAGKPMPKIRNTEIGAFRAHVNALTAHAPRYDVPMAGTEDRSIPGPDGIIGIRIYTPIGSGPFPAIVFYHGGGFVIGDLNISDPICRALCSGVGAVVVSVDYRLAPEHPFPAPNDDCWAALQWVAENAAALNADRDRIAVCGDSAGASLSASMTLRARAAGFPLRAQALLYPAPDMPGAAHPSFVENANASSLTADDCEFYWDQYFPTAASRTDPDALAALAESHAGLPPAFVATADLDPIRDIGVSYARLLEEAGVPVEAHVYGGMPHGFFTFVAHAPSVQAAMADLCKWLKANL